LISSNFSYYDGRVILILKFNWFIIDLWCSKTNLLESLFNLWQLQLQDQNSFENSCPYVLGLSNLPPFLRFPIIYRGCSNGVVLGFFISLINLGTLWDLLNTYFILFNILRSNTTTHTTNDLNLFWLYLCIVFIAAICIPIKLHQLNQTRSTTWRTFIGCKYSSYFISFCNLQYMYMYNLYSLRRIYTKYSNSTTNKNSCFNSNQT